MEPFSLTQCQSINEDKFRKLRRDEYLMEPKIDGWRMQVDVDDGDVTAWTRTRHKATGKLVMPERILSEFNTTRMRLDGEVVYLDSNGKPDYNFTARCLGSGVDVCVDKQMEDGKFLTYMVFDILFLQGQDLRDTPFAYRRGLLVDVLHDINPYVSVVEVEEPSIENHSKFIEQYGEGSVLKVLSSSYAGKRHKSWLKWKAEETIEVRIIGYKDGQGKFAGLIGAIEFRAADGTIGNCSGMDDEMRVWISNHREELKGTVIEVKHYGRLVDGFRHPQFVRLRADK